MSEWKETEIGQIPINWEVGTIDHIAEVVTDGAHLSPKLFLGGRFMASVKDMTYNKFNFSECKTISEPDFEKLQKQGCSPKFGDILISKDGEKCLDLIFVYDQEEEIVLLSSIAIVRLKENFNPHFYRYYLLSHAAQTIMNKWFRSGSAIPRVVLRDFKKVPIPLLEKKEQDNIASILLNIDKKITLLRQQNQDLEELAQTLFKRWFVEFEFPNENGEPYKSSGGKMVASELGEIPVEWSIGEISNHVSHSTKSINPNNQPDKEFYHYSIPAFDNGKHPVLELGNDILSNKYIVAEKSILVSKLNPSTSRIWTVFVTKPNAICSTEIQVFIPKPNRYAFAFGLFHYNGVKKEMAQRASGTSSSHQRVRPGDILNIECIVPTNETLKKFNGAVFDSLKKVENNQEEIQTLTQLRDTLLPKLMSGELRVKFKRRLI